MEILKQMNFLNYQTSTNKLKEGSSVITIAVSSPVNDQVNIIEGLKIFETWGLTSTNKVITGRHWGYLSGEDATRYKDLHPEKS